jgi:hypothetical protein
LPIIQLLFNCLSHSIFEILIYSIWRLFSSVVSVITVRFSRKHSNNWVLILPKTAILWVSTYLLSHWLISDLFFKFVWLSFHNSNLNQCLKESKYDLRTSFNSFGSVVDLFFRFCQKCSQKVFLGFTLSIKVYNNFVRIEKQSYSLEHLIPIFWQICNQTLIHNFYRIHFFRL